MKYKVLLLSAIFMFLILGVSADSAQETATDREHTEWVASVIRKVQTVKPGMTRNDLSALFTTEGGLSNRLHRVYVLKTCPYIKVQVEFEAVGNKDFLVERPEDKIAKISDAFLQFAVMD